MTRRKRGQARNVRDQDQGCDITMIEGGPVSHIPVLLSHVIKVLQPQKGSRYIDATFGAGGYSRAILDAADCELLALDRDPHAIRDGQTLVMHFGDRLHLSQTAFSHLEQEVQNRGWPKVDGIVFDLGVSSMQLDQSKRGFSFMRDGPLDMRMSQNGVSAADVVNTFEKDHIANILYRYGEEKRSRLIASAIVKDRIETPFETTKQLANLVSRLLGQSTRFKHPATRTFQALRLFVNDELGELETALAAAERILAPGGRLLVVSFHSLEDRIVKQFLVNRSGRTAHTSRYMPEANETTKATFIIENKQGLEADEAEIVTNPRSRSARLRWGIRTDTPLP